MRAYGVIETGFWQNPKIRALDRNSREMLLYLYTCPHGNSVGCFMLPLGYVMDDLDLDQDKARVHLRHLVACGFIERNEDTGLTRIVGWWGHNKIDNPGVAAAACKQLAGLPADPIVDRAIQDLKANLEAGEFAPRVREALREKWPHRKPTVRRPAGTETVNGELFENSSEAFANGSVSRARVPLPNPTLPNPTQTQPGVTRARTRGAEPPLAKARLGPAPQPPDVVQQITPAVLAEFGPEVGLQLLSDYATGKTEAVAKVEALLAARGPPAGEAGAE